MQGGADDTSADKTAAGDAGSAYVYDSHRGIVAGPDAQAADLARPANVGPAVDLDNLFDAVQQAYKAEGIAAVHYDAGEPAGDLAVVIADSPPGAAGESALPEESLRALLDAGEIDADDLARRVGGRTDSYSPRG